MQKLEEIFPNWFEIVIQMKMKKFIKKWLDEFTDQLIDEQVETFRKSLLAKKVELATEVFITLKDHFNLDEKNITISFPISKI